MNGITWMKYLILFIVAFLPSIVYIIWIRNTERYEREPWFRIGATFVWGAVFGVILGVLFSVILMVVFGLALPERLYDAISENESYSTILLVCIIAPIAEEAAKGLGVFTAGRDLDEVEDGLVYGASVGLGFAATENLLYEYVALTTAGFAAFVVTAIVRSISSALLHASATSATGYGIAKKKILGPGNHIIPYYLLAVLMHAAFNFLAVIGIIFAGNAGAALFGLLVAIMFAIAAIEFTRNKIHQLDVSHLAREKWRRYI